MFSKILQIMFGNSTRSVQSICLSTNIIWIILVSLPLINVPIDTPKIEYGDFPYIHVLCMLSIIFSVLGFTNPKHSYRQQLFKTAGLIFGSLVQAIISSLYVTVYPPFEPMLIVCSLLSLWFLSAVIYISNIEGIKCDGTIK